MLITQLSLFVENTPGSLSKVCQVLKQHQINIRTLSLADTQQYGILRLLVKEHEAASTALTEAGFTVKATGVLALSVPDTPGGLADILSVFDEYQLPVEYLYAFAGAKDEQAVIVLRVEDSPEMQKLCRDPRLNLIKAAELYR